MSDHNVNDLKEMQKQCKVFFIYFHPYFSCLYI